jgi:hypothetical protein
MAMVTIEGPTPLHLERYMIDKLMIIGAYAIPALGLLFLCFWITRKK